MYDLIIIGASAAGLSASVYAARRNLKFLVISKDIGGEVALSGEVGNWPGIIKINGMELAKNFEDHAKFYNTEIREGTEVLKIEQKDNIHIVHTKKGAKKVKLDTKSIIVASGIHPRELGIQGEKDFRGKGITYCTVCDGPLFKGKITATIGAGNAGLESALMMSGIAEKVYLISNKPNTKEMNGGFPKGENILIDKVKKAKNIEIIYNANTTKILGDKMVSSLKYEDSESKKEKELEVGGVMVHIGTIPNSYFIDCVNKDKQKSIKIDQKCQTSCKGIFAAGDVTNIPHKQIVIAAGQGVIAVLSAIDYINRFETK
ncbi:MAG: FAD-dependent oxidoreductase [Candidatus Magasanikbacteria bacterium]|nr:FAD-dependent oxidoreductase [Candidatus Magasanikbacteria bacterium]